MNLRFPPNQISWWASQYECPANESYIVNKISPAVRRRGYLKKEEFLRICHWKTPRSAPQCGRNRDSYVREVTRTAFSSRDEELKIKILTLLYGVNWPTASAILHFCDQGKYPILDVRTRWSVSIPRSHPYDIDLWMEYCNLMRSLSIRTHLNMRTIDRGLWQFAKTEQPRRRA